MGRDRFVAAKRGRSLPVIAEINGPGDTNLFLALIQTLTYTSELSTPNQFRRLNQQHRLLRFSYPFQLDPAKPLCDIFIIYFEQKEPALKDEAIRLAEALLRDPASPVAQVVRLIVFARAVPGD